MDEKAGVWQTLFWAFVGICGSLAIAMLAVAFLYERPHRQCTVKRVQPAVISLTGNSPKPDATPLPENPIPEYSIIHRQHKDYPDIQHRSFRILSEAVAKRADAETVLRVVWEQATREIERSSPRAHYKRINLLFYTDEMSERQNEYACHAACDAGPTFPKWPPARIQWRWRTIHDEGAPTLQDRRIEDVYHTTAVAAENRAEAILTNIHERERLKKEFKREIREEIGKRHGVSQFEVSVSIARVRMWRVGVKQSQEQLEQQARDVGE